MGEKVTTAIQNLETYLTAFTELSKRGTGHRLPGLRKLREDAFESFCETGFPTTHDEDWRFTNLSSIVRTPFSLAEGPDATVLHSNFDSDLKPWRLDVAAARLVFVDGQFVRHLSSIGVLPPGIVISSLKQEIENAEELLEDHLGRYLNIQRDPFCALNTAFVEDGVFVHVGKGVSLEAPIHLLFLSSGSEFPTMMHPRNLLLIEREAQATFIEEYVSLRDSTVFSNSATELVVGENSTVSHS